MIPILALALLDSEGLESAARSSSPTERAIVSIPTVLVKTLFHDFEQGERIGG